MRDLNLLTLTGRLYADPEMTYTPGGLAITRLPLVSSDDYQKDGNWVERSNWFNITFFGKAAEAYANKFVKGDHLTVQCKVESNNYEKDGKKYSGYNFTGIDVFRAPKKNTGGSKPSEPKAAQAEYDTGSDDPPWE